MVKFLFAHYILTLQRMGTSMSQSKVFVIWTNPLFIKSIRLVLKHPDILIVGATSNYPNASRRITKLQPDTVLVETTAQMQPEDVLRLLDTCPWNMRVMLLSLDDNHLRSYHREQRAVEHADDLLITILQDPTEREEERRNRLNN